MVQHLRGTHTNHCNPGGPNRALVTTLLKRRVPQLRAVVPPLQLQQGITEVEKADTIQTFIMTHWAILGPHIDLSIRAWNIDQYRPLFGAELGEEIFVFNQEQAQILVAADRQTIPYRLPQPVEPAARGEPAQQQGALAYLLQRRGREVGQDINRAGNNSPPDDHLTFLRTTSFARGTVNSMRQQI